MGVSSGHLRRSSVSRFAQRRLLPFVQRSTGAPVPRAAYSAPAILAAPLEHGAVGVWDEVALIAVGTIVVVAYGLWLYVVRNRK